MANEVVAFYLTDRTLYFTVQDLDFNYWNGSAFVSRNAANWFQYAWSTTQPQAGNYQGTFRVQTRGLYIVRL